MAQHRDEVDVSIQNAEEGSAAGRWFESYIDRGGGGGGGDDTETVDHRDAAVSGGGAQFSFGQFLRFLHAELSGGGTEQQ